MTPLPPDPSDPNDLPPAANDKPPGVPAKPRKRRWLRRTIYVVLVLLVIVVGLVLLAPTIASTGAARNFILGKVNENINGKVTIRDWSIGWHSGITVDDLRVFDEAQRQILQIPKFHSDLSLTGLIHGEIHLGNTTVDGLDFFLEQYADGTSNFSKLAKPGEKKAESRPHESEQSNKEPGKLPTVDGEFHLLNSRGTFQDDASGKTILFKTLTADAKIPSINSPIENKLNVLATVDGHELLSFGATGSPLIAADNRMLPPGKITGTETITFNAGDLKLLQSVIDAFQSAAGPKAQPAGQPPAEAPTKLAGGSLGGIILIVGDNAGVTVSPNLSGKDVTLDKGGVPDQVGNCVVDGKFAIVPGKSTAISNILFSNFRILGVGSGVVLNGTAEDITQARNFHNVTADLTYNLAMLFDFARPMLSKEQQQSLKDVKIAGNFTKRQTLNGSYPANLPMNQAIVPLNADGEFTIELFDSSGAVLKTFTLPYFLSGGKLRVAYANKPAGQDLPAPADFNSGKFSVAGSTIDLAPVHPTLTMPDGTKMLDAVSINPLFAQTYLSGWLHNPLFAGVDKASAQLFVTMKHCDRLPLDNLVQENDPANTGSADIELSLTGLELGSKFINQLNSVMAMVNRGKIASGGLALTIPQWTVSIAHGMVTQDLKLMIGGNPPMDLAGSVSMKTHALNMILTIPISNEQSIKIPVTGTADDPKLDTRGVLQQNLQNIPGVPKELKGILGGGGKSTTQPAGKANGVNDLLNDVFNKKDKKSGSSDGDAK